MDLCTLLERAANLIDFSLIVTPEHDDLMDAIAGNSIDDKFAAQKILLYDHRRRSNLCLCAASPVANLRAHQMGYMRLRPRHRLAQPNAFAASAVNELDNHWQCLRADCCHLIVPASAAGGATSSHPCTMDSGLLPVLVAPIICASVCSERKLL